MTILSALPFAAAILCLLLAVASALRKSPSPAAWCFSAGMAILAVDSLFTGLSLRSEQLSDVRRWLTYGLVTKSFLPAPWLAFSLTYSRGEYRESMARWRTTLAIAGLLPLALVLGFRGRFVTVVPAEGASDVLLLRLTMAGTILNTALLVALVLVLTNLEQTFRAAVGTMRWRLKFVVLGLGVMFGAQVYVRSQAILFSAPDPALAGVESSALLIGCLFLAVAYARTGLAEIDVYPSRSVLRSSFTVLVVGGYLFAVGVLAQVVKRLGGAGSFQFQALVVLVGMAGLVVLLASDRVRRRLQDFVGRHFGRAQHDSARIWAEFSRQLTHVKDSQDLCSTSARLISETFDVLSVTIWLLDEHEQQMSVGASTAYRSGEALSRTPTQPLAAAVAAGLREKSAPFDLELASEVWASDVRDACPAVFPNGGHRWCVALRTDDHVVGMLILADRVEGAVFSVEDLELLQCVAVQITSVLINQRLAGAVARARELDTFRSMSAFFVHDLKNTAASLNLMLKNLPVHFDDPEFRADALTAIGNTARRIDDMISRLSAIRRRPELARVETDVNRLVAESLEELGQMPGVDVRADLQPVPTIAIDREQIKSVITNLLLNARDAVIGDSRPAGTNLAPSDPGHVLVCTREEGTCVVLSVSDDGCGMSPEFVNEGLFLPFRSTKPKGLGIGMFQVRMVVEAHGGSIRAASAPGNGTVVRVALPRQ